MLRLLTWPYVRKHKVRSLLTLAGIVLGVAVFVGMHTANQTVSHAFQRTIDRIAGKTQLQVTAGETGFPEAALEKVQNLREAGAVSPVIEAVLSLPGKGNILVLGVDMTGDASLRDYDFTDEDAIDDPLVFLAQPDSLMLSERFARANTIERGAKITLATMDGPREFTVRGIMKDGGLASAFGGNVAVMDVYAAQLIFGRGRMFDRLDIGAAEGFTVEQCQAAIAAALGSGFEVEPPSNRGRHFDSIARGLAISINVTSLFALLIGVFLIYNSFSIAITQRRTEIGILRSLGASRGAILRMFIAEAALAGAVASAIGVWAGLLLARGVSPALSYLVREVYGNAQVVEQISWDWRLVAAAMAIGIGVSIAGGWLPARAAASVDPIKALRKGDTQGIAPGGNRIRRAAAVALGVASALALAFGRDDRVFYAGYMFSVVAMVLLTPTLSGWLARALRPVLKRLRPVEGALAADSLIQAPRRTSATVSALTLSLALAVGFAGVAGAIFTSVTEWMNGVLNPELVVAPTESITARQFRFPMAVKAEIESVPGVAEVAAIRNARVLVDGLPAMAIVVDQDYARRRVNARTVEGSSDEMLRGAKAGQGVYLSDSLARIRRLHKGDKLNVDTPSGRVSLPILGSIVDYSDQRGAFFLDPALYNKLWRDDTANIFRVHTAPGASTETVRQAITRKLEGRRKVFVFTNAELRQFVIDATNQWFGMTYLQLAVALLVAILGIVNTLTVSIADRRRELGILQAVGALRAQVRHTIWMEAVAIGAIGLTMGVVAGAIMLFYNLDMVSRDVGGLVLPYQYPYGFALLLVPVILGAALVAALWPAEAAVRASLVESLEYE
ncbi:MAG: FtsX-like permease family protein [Bryobacteraceae bacterium]